MEVENALNGCCCTACRVNVSSSNAANKNLQLCKLRLYKLCEQSESEPAILQP
jgi:hypothetical protein